MKILEAKTAANASYPLARLLRALKLIGEIPSVLSARRV
jgi:hypothetical protein